MVENASSKGSLGLVLAIVAAGFIIAAVIVTVDINSTSMEVVSASPLEGTTGVDLYANVTIDFSQTLSALSFKEDVTFSPPVVGEWSVEGSTCTFQTGSRMGSNTEYTITVGYQITSTSGHSLTEPYVLKFTTGNTSSRVIANGTSAQLDYIAYDEDGLVFATSMKSVADDEVNYSKSPLYIDVYKERLGKLRKFPIIVGKETEFKVIEDKVLGMKIGEKTNFTLGPDEIFGVENQSLIYQKSLSENVSYSQLIDTDTAIDAFNGNLTVGAKGIHPLWGWNVTYVSDSPGGAVIQNEPEDGMIIQPYGWDTVVSLGSNISLQHQVNSTHVYRIMGVSGTFPEELFMVREVNITGGYVLVDENWPPVICGQATHWEITVHDVKVSSV